MSVEIVVPTLGESVTEATIARWLKNAGDSVAADEPLVELETDKVTVEIPAPQAGVLSEVLFGEGDNVEVGALLGRIGEGNGAAAPAVPAPSPAPAPAASPAPAAVSAARDPLDGAGPAAVKAATEAGVTGAQIPAPSGRDGRATKADVAAAAAQPAPPPAPIQVPAPAASAAVTESGNRNEERVRMSRLRLSLIHI